MANRINFYGPTLGSPEWCGDDLGRDQLLPGGAKVNAADAGFVADAYGRKPIPSGTVVGRTLAERDLQTGFGPAAATDDEVMIVAFDVTDALVLDDVELVRPYAGVVIKENFLPGFGGLVAGVVTILRARYNLTRGAE